MNSLLRIVFPAGLRTLAIAANIVCLAAISAKAPEATVLGVDGPRFTINGKPTFLLGFSYYGGLGAPGEFVRRDLADAQRHEFNWLRLWVTWEFFGEDVSAVDATGRPRQP